GRPEGQRSAGTLYWEHFGLCGGQQALRSGRWKAVRIGIRADSAAPLELYDVVADPSESANLAAEHPQVVADLWARMRQARVPSRIDRWNFTMADSPRASSANAPHSCFPWVG